MKILRILISLKILRNSINDTKRVVVQNKVYYWSCRTTHEHYNYLQLIKLIKMEKYIQQIIKNSLA
jgi:hypothetical protein